MKTMLVLVQMMKERVNDKIVHQKIVWKAEDLVDEENERNEKNETWMSSDIDNPSLIYSEIQVFR